MSDGRSDRQARRSEREETAGAGRLSVGRVLRRNFPVLAAVAVFSLGINLLMLTGPVFMLQIYARVLPSHNVDTLVALFMLVVLLYVVLGLLETVRTQVLTRVATRVSVDLRRRLFDVVTQLALRSGGSPKATIPLQEVGAVSGFFGGPAVAAFYDAPMVPVYLFTIYLLHPLLFWYALGAAVLLFMMAVLNDLLSRRPQRAGMRAAAKASQILQAAVRNAEALTAMGMMPRLRRRWQVWHDEQLAQQLRAAGRIGTVSATSKALRLLIQSAILALGALLVIRGEITAGVMIAASIILGRALQPVEQAITNWRAYQRYRAAKRAIDRALAAVETRFEARTVPETEPQGRLEVAELYVAPPGARDPFLRNVNFRLPAGSLLAVAGANGSGKTMLARAIVGVWHPLRGEVRLDGAALDKWPPQALGRLLGYLPQDVELVEGTVAENIARLDPEATDEAVIRAARQAGVHEDIKAMGGYDRDVGPGGAALSAGQRQRIGLARALYGDPVLVVLDEPDANLDPPGVAALEKALMEMKQRGQTVVLIVHNDRLLRLADFILVLRNGEVVRGGPRDKVLGGTGRKPEPPAPPSQEKPEGERPKSHRPAPRAPVLPGGRS